MHALFSMLHCFLCLAHFIYSFIHRIFIQQPVFICRTSGDILLAKNIGKLALLSCSYHLEMMTHSKQAKKSIVTNTDIINALKEKYRHLGKNIIGKVHPWC